VTDAYHVLRSKLIYERYFPEVRLVGVPLGRQPPLSDALREVGALIGFAVFSARHWL
jgi:uncharacterized SAM-binding protein YcdF (DUF218 family)